MEKEKIEILEFQDSVLALPCYKYLFRVAGSISETKFIAMSDKVLTFLS
jgi:hypothetical protein